MSQTPVHTRPAARSLATLLLTLALGLGGAAVNTLVPPASALAAVAPEAAGLEAALQTFQRAAAGDEHAIEPAAEALERLSQAQPTDPVLLAYAGAATALRATTTMLPWRKMGFAEDGLARLDKALALLTPAHDAAGPRGVPPALEARFTAASTFLSLPGLFKRHARGQKLLAEVLAHPGLAACPLPFRGAVWLRAGTEAAANQQTADARHWLQQIVASQAPQAAAAQAKLKDLGA